MGVQKHFKSRGILYVVFLVSLLLNMSARGYFDGESLTIGDELQEGGGPCFYAKMDAGGYSDAIYYGWSEEHPYDFHELLSGEWGAALYYDGIATERIDPDLPYRKAMWLTKEFEAPQWFTGTDFGISGPCEAWENESNPAPLKDTGRSFIANNEVEVQIIYEVVDLEYRNPNEYLCRSPLGFLEQDKEDSNFLRSAYVYSDRYIFLQTYIIKNISGQTLSNLAFYQMLHSHGADEFRPYVNSTYLPIGYEDPLEDYVPYDPNHCAPGNNTAGNFRFDITQWNIPPIGTYKHADYAGFSCAVAPDWIDTDVYGGLNSGVFKPREGTHINIENRVLNGKDHLYLDKAAGALGWDLGSLELEETVKRTVAFMFCYGGKEPVRHGLYVIKSDDAGDCFDSTDPNAAITYTITYGNADPNAVTEPNVVLIDYLPAEADRFSVQPSGGGVYDLFKNTVTWEIGTLYVNDWGQESVTFKITQAKGGGELVNKAVLKNEFNLAQYTLRTPVCPWDVGETVYVDKFAPGLQDGSNWQDAFHDLQEAIAYINSGYDAEEIWIADGTYKPGIEDGDSFVIPDGVAVYGGFAGYTNPTETKESRNWRKNRTVLSGFIFSMPNEYGGEDVYRNNTVVTMGNNTLLDGVTVKAGADYGIYGNGADFVIENCRIIDNEQYGIRAKDGDVSIEWCEVKNNGVHGIYHTGEEYINTIKNCWIHKNIGHGIFAVSTTPLIRNTIISENGSVGESTFGVRIVNPSYEPVMYNNTIVYNRKEGISFIDNGTLNDPNNKDWPDVQNCILWYNNNGGAQVYGFEPDHTAYYCCIQDCNDVNYNIDDEPSFAYSDPNNLHLAWDSPCRDAGNPAHTTEDVGLEDMDSEDRVYNSRVDIGADEIYSCDDDLSEDDIYHPLDWNADGLVNYREFGVFSKAWLTEYPDPNFNPQCDLYEDDVIDLADLAELCKDNPQVWLWTACWKRSQMGHMQTMFYSMMGGGGDSMLALSGAEGMMSIQPVLSPIEGMMESLETEIQIEESKSIEQQILELEDAIEFLEKIWLEESDIQETIDPEDWKQFMEAVYDSLHKLKT